MRGGIQRAFCQSRRPSFEGQQNAAHAEDGRFQPVADCRFSIFDCRFAKRPPLWRLKNVLFKVRNGAETRRNVKNGTTSGDVYENTGDDDKMSGEKAGFYTKMHSLREDQQESVGFLGRECISYTIRQDGRRQTADGKRGETVGTTCGCQGPGQALSGSLREATSLANCMGGSP